MSTTNSNELRQSYLRYFEKNGHTIVKSAPLIPANDPTLMFTNAGMVQFKDVFVGAEKRPYRRATTCQKCLRVSGKHNDLEEVGRTARHQTFFEMLGNFSFGDYFKEDAIAFAWTLLTQEWQLDPKRLWITVFGGAEGVPRDNEARALWRKISGLPDERILDKGMKDNFWAMGDTGPCGPCTEIHFDTKTSGTPSPADFDNGRVVEIWNNVFMQFERHADGSLVPLPKPCVDTGMGLERVAALVAGEDSNYHSALFAPLLEVIGGIAGKKYQRSPSEDDVSMRVIADHARTTAFLVADGIQPSNEGRGYVLRRIMRRAIRHGKRLGLNDIFFPKVCDTVVTMMQSVYPELGESRSLIQKVSELEEHGFRRTLDTGLKLLGDAIGETQKRGSKTLDGATVFKLYDTYGFPKDLTEVLAGENGMQVDDAGFAEAMNAQRERSRGADVGEAAVDAAFKTLKARLGLVEFVGYTHEDIPLGERPGVWREHTATGQDERGVRYLQAQTRVVAMIANGQEITTAASGVDTLDVVLNPTPFYGESGGQVGDRGVIINDGDLLAEVLDTQKPLEGLSVTKVRVHRGVLRVGESVWAGYVPEIRKQTRAHHSATHLLHGSLRKTLGDHVKQSGSQVDPEHLRFDYSHFSAPTAAELKTVEDDTNRRVLAAHDVSTDSLSFDEAKRRGALAFFGDKYGDVVRMVSMGESIELCGGTHAKNTADLSLVLITGEEAVASGVRRLQAEVGAAAYATSRRNGERLTTAAMLLSGATVESLPATEAVLLAVAKVARAYAQTVSALKAAGLQATEVGRSSIRAPELLGAQPTKPDPRDIKKAQALRDTWHALVQITNAKPAEAEAIAASHPLDSGILKGFLALSQAVRENERKLEDVKRAAMMQNSDAIIATAKVLTNGVRLLTHRQDGLDAKSLRELCDHLRDKLGSAIVCLASANDGKVSLLVAVAADLTSRFSAGKIVQQLAPLVGGKGGGKADLAQAGGQNPEGITAALAQVEKLLS